MGTQRGWECVEGCVGGRTRRASVQRRVGRQELVDLIRGIEAMRCGPHARDLTDGELARLEGLYWELGYMEQVADRAAALLAGAVGVTLRYARAAVDCGRVEVDGLRLVDGRVFLA